MYFRAFAFSVATLFLTPAARGAGAWPSFAEWETACSRLVRNRDLKTESPLLSTLPLGSFDDFERAMGPFLQSCLTGQLSQASAWLGAPPSSDFYNLGRAHFFNPPAAFEPYVQRLQVPAGSEILFHADLHGDVHSLISGLAWLNRKGELKGFNVVRSNLFLIFLGDYGDRGHYGIEVLYTLLRLRLANPEQVHLLRGNHEDYRIVARYGLLAEGAKKFPGTFNAARLCRMFEFLPTALYLGSGTNFVQCNHGGMEPGFNPGPLLDAKADHRFQRIRRLERQSWLDADNQFSRSKIAPSLLANNPSEFSDFIPTSPTTPVNLGFLWNDFTVASGEAALAVDDGRGAIFGDALTRGILRMGSTPSNRLRAVFRGHQHAATLNPMMARLLASRGLFRHWQGGDSTNALAWTVSGLSSRLETQAEQAVPDGSVWTLNVAPDSVYGLRCGYDFDVLARLTVQEDFSRWRLRRITLLPEGSGFREE